MPISVADEKDVASIVGLLDNAYRGENSKQGWTSEANLFAGEKRTDEATISNLIKKQEAVFLKYLNEDKIIEGCVFLHKKADRLYLGMFSVSPVAQGKGIGKKLLAAADEYAKKVNCSSIFMTVITVRQELIAWYERHGYTRTGKVLPFPVDERFGVPTQSLEMVVLEKRLAGA
ncbi:MAG TPA: GNAT family N-acetyltransferase, partial [Chitinophagaceae bacterium]|nr:GNAT family N-acetyltransferase [Chitinophagaceae bacterium]